MAKEATFEMMITVHLSDGRKITKDSENLVFFTMTEESAEDIAEKIEPGKIVVSADHIVDMRPAEPDEIEHAKIHGW